jgi:hypothetical protein
MARLASVIEYGSNGQVVRNVHTRDEVKDEELCCGGSTQDDENDHECSIATNRESQLSTPCRDRS